MRSGVGMLKHSTTELSASPKASPLGDPARRPRGAGRRELALRGRGRRRGPRPPLPEHPPRPTCGRSCRAPREGGGRAALPPPQVPRGRGSPHPGGLGAPAPRRPLPGRAGGSGRRGGGDARAGGGGSPASTGSRPAERGGRRQEAELCRSARGTAPLPGVGEGPRAPGPAATGGPAVVTATAPPPPRGGGGARCPAAPPAPPLACGQRASALAARSAGPLSGAGLRCHWPGEGARLRDWPERAANRGGAAGGRVPPSERGLRGREGSAAAAGAAMLGVGGKRPVSLLCPRPRRHALCRGGESGRLPAGPGSGSGSRSRPVVVPPHAVPSAPRLPGLFPPCPQVMPGWVPHQAATG